MKFSGGGDSEILCGGGPVDTLLLTSCWGGAGGGSGTEPFLMDAPAHKLVMDSCSTTDEDSTTKATMDALDSLLLTSPSQNSPPGSNSNFAELKPLPPFTGYTGHLSINGIPGHHFHAIAAPQSPQSPHNTVSSLVETNNNNAHTTNHNTNNNLIFKSGNNNGGTTVYYTVSTTADQPVVSSSTVDGVQGVIKPEFVDYSLLPPEIEDIAAIIGSAIADTTVPNVDGLVGPGEDPAASRDSWMDLDAWIDTACGENNVQNGGSNGKAIISAESLQEFVANSQFVVSVSPEDSGTTGPSSTLQSLLTQGIQQQQQAFTQQAALLLKREPSTTTTTNYQQHHHMPLLQSRLQNGPPSLSNGAIKPESTSAYLSECPSPSSSTSYLSNKEMILPHTTTGSPPGHVVSTTDNTLLMNGGRYQGVHQNRSRPGYSHIRGLKTGGVPSPDLLVNGGSLDSLVTGSGLVHGNYPHTTAATTTTPSPSKSKSRSRSGRKQHSGGGGGGGGGASVIYTADGSSGMMGKEKPVHRCTICNRGFLNKSNIKVHLRTHTGEKPFRCEVCGKAFRQKAHLIKHQQIHKRVGRD